MKPELFEIIKTARSRRFLTNCYSMAAAEHADRIWKKEDSFVFSAEDHGVFRLFFFAKDYAELGALLSETGNGIYYLDLMTKDPKEFVPPDSELVAGMKRLANPDCSSVFLDSPVLQYRDDSVGEAAAEEDAHEINRILWETFHTEVSHLLTDEELAEAIRKGQVFIHRGKEIDAVLQAEILPKKFYINQVVNRTEKRIIHAVLLKELRRYAENGGKYLYAWVAEDNIASLKFHEKYGMTHDGMWNMVYRLDRRGQ